MPLRSSLPSVAPPLLLGGALYVLFGGMLAATAAWPFAAQAEVNRCVSPDGAPLFTDRRCADLGAAPGVPGAIRGGSGRVYRGGCARNLQDLVHEMTSAIDGGDVNRLASVYHWAGMSGRAANAVMTRLGAVVKRPLIDIVPVVPAAADGVDGWLYPQTTVDHPPVALRVEQTLANGSTPSRTVFGMQRHFGCYWIKG